MHAPHCIRRLMVVQQGRASKIVIAGVPDFGRAFLNIIQTCSPQPWRNCSNNARGNVVL
jgi:hypothetical protein